MRILRATIATAALPGLLLATLPTPAAAQLGQRYVEVFGTDPCPSGGTNEIVVCARKKESDRYRIPERLRQSDQTGANETWASRAQSLEYAGRGGTQSCSPVGPGGVTGCELQLIRQARAERKQQNADAPVLP